MLILPLLTYSYKSLQKDQLCQSLEEDNVKNSLLKFGLITQLIENVNKFKKSMKTLSTAGQKVGLKQKTDKSAKTRINTRTNTRTDKEVSCNNAEITSYAMHDEVDAHLNLHGSHGYL